MRRKQTRLSSPRTALTIQIKTWEFFPRNCLDENSWRTPNFNLWKGLASSMEHPEKFHLKISKVFPDEGKTFHPDIHHKSDDPFVLIRWISVISGWCQQLPKAKDHVPTLVVASFKGMCASMPFRPSGHVFVVFFMVPWITLQGVRQFAPAMKPGIPKGNDSLLSTIFQVINCTLVSGRKTS